MNHVSGCALKIIDFTGKPARISGETEVVTLVIQGVTKIVFFFIESLEPLPARVAA